MLIAQKLTKTTNIHTHQNTPEDMVDKPILEEEAKEVWNVLNQCAIAAGYDLETVVKNHSKRDSSRELALMVYTFGAFSSRSIKWMQGESTQGVQDDLVHRAEKRACYKWAEAIYDMVKPQQQEDEEVVALEPETQIIVTSINATKS